MDILKDVYGYDALTEQQQVILNQIDAGKDVLALMETGGGKSICYQLPVLKKRGRALVITPLISLMEDQVAGLRRLGIKAAAIHSYLDIREKRMLFEQLNDYTFIFCSPEWLTSIKGDQFLKNMQFTHIVVDEAHCIADWGYDFRPHYLLIDEVLILQGAAQLIMLTATANKQTISDIASLVSRDLTVVDVRQPKQNIFLAVTHIEAQSKLKEVSRILVDAGPSIIYFSSKKVCDEVCAALIALDFSGMTYHADMTYEERMNVQQLFLNDRLQFVCATSAFGMGINKSNIRTIIHYHLPKSPFQYMQEIGRAGRDGEVCQAILLHDDNDQHLYYDDAAAEYELFKAGVQLPEERMEYFSVLERKFKPQEIRRFLPEKMNEKTNRYLMMQRYAHSAACLHQQLYNGAPCGFCSNCDRERTFKFKNIAQQLPLLSPEKYIDSLF